MKISEAIDSLLKLKENIGDVEVVLDTDSGFLSIYSITDEDDGYGGRRVVLWN